MSFRAPKVRKRRSPTKSPSKAPTETSDWNEDVNPPSTSNVTVHHHLVPAKNVHRTRRPPNTVRVARRGGGGLWVEGAGPGLTFTQVAIPQQVQRTTTVSQLPPSSSSYLEDPSATTLDPHTSQSPTNFHNDNVDPFADESPYFIADINRFIHRGSGDDDAEPRRLRQRCKREKQWQKWTQTTIPALLDHYLEYLRTSESLRLPHRLSPDITHDCLCTRRTRLAVICVFLDSTYC